MNADSFEEISSRVKFLGFIQKGEKINVKHVVRQPNNWHTSLSRTVLHPDNRANTLDFLKDLISKAIILSKDNESLLQDLKKAVQGLTNLKVTYEEDTKFCCDLDVLIEKIIH